MSTIESLPRWMKATTHATLRRAWHTLPAWLRHNARHGLNQALTRVSPEQADKVNEARVTANLAPSRETNEGPIAFYPVNKATLPLVQSLLRTKVIRPTDVLVLGDDATLGGLGISPGSTPGCTFDELSQTGSRCIYLLQTNVDVERKLTELKYEGYPLSVNDLELVTYPFGEQVFTKSYRRLAMSYRETVVPPLHYSNYTYIQFLKTIVRPGMRVLDAFAGPGTVGLSVAKECGLSEISLFDLNPASVAMIQANAAANFAGDFKCRAYRSNLFQDIPADRKFDLIIGNPPHNFDAAAVNEHLPELLYVQAHDREMKTHFDFFTQAADRLAPGGRICLLENGQKDCIQIRHIRELLAKHFPRFLIHQHVEMTGSPFYIFTAGLD